mmetsp:Transcript_22229/g.60750  ORF Transcript_22229/g.60750 Transcript_22229/m.60750 type:complete len:83 (+) Transcript_22229:777-1025(+)
MGMLIFILRGAAMSHFRFAVLGKLQKVGNPPGFVVLLSTCSRGVLELFVLYPQTLCHGDSSWRELVRHMRHLPRRFISYDPI